ncbi:hypothetical protein PENNAL_c0671G10748 [Penicillium nalgiovense]|uniref:Uncharacterized protein n=1 Tax=Penicillium nalgiovense TaxID=60175 RepID=A0A1V6V031_PENNA|nr:hypothetical protein PENNAL_c0671G10748 [Penicillium nalgiovense]
MNRQLLCTHSEHALTRDLLVRN